MLVYFTNKNIHQKIVDVDDDIYEFLSKFQCSAFTKQIYLADDGYYEIKEDTIYRHQLEINKTQQAPMLKSPDLVVSMTTWNKSEASVLPTNSIKVDVIIERFKINDSVSFVIERNDEETVDYFFEIKGKNFEESDIISFLSQITYVCLN